MNKQLYEGEDGSSEVQEGLKCKYASIYCVVSNELVYDSSDCLVTVVKHK